MLAAVIVCYDINFREVWMSQETFLALWYARTIEQGVRLRSR